MRRILFGKTAMCFSTRAPELFARIELQILFLATAEAFGKPGRNVLFMSSREGLSSYMAFTKMCMEGERPDPGRIYRTARRLGNRIRMLSGFREDDELEKLIFMLYKNIGITMEGSIREGFVFRKCIFSRIYTPAQCRLMSAMDSGIIAGICGGKVLRFSCRITEGADTCRALLMGRRTE